LLRRGSIGAIKIFAIGAHKARVVCGGRGDAESAVLRSTRLAQEAKWTSFGLDVKSDQVKRAAARRIAESADLLRRTSVPNGGRSSHGIRTEHGLTVGCQFMESKRNF